MKIYRQIVTINEKEEMTINSQRKLNFVGLAKEINKKYDGDIISIVIDSVKEEEIDIEQLLQSEKGE